MANMVSQVTLAVHVSGEESLNNLKKTLTEVEDLLKKTKDIKFSVESSALDGMSKSLKEISTQLQNLNTDTSTLDNLGSNVDLTSISSMVDDLEKELSSLSTQPINVGDAIDTSGAMSKVQALKTELSTITVTMSHGSGQNTTGTGMSSWADQYNKEVEKVATTAETASQKLAQALNTGAYQKVETSQSSWLNQYSNVGTGISESLDKARQAATEYRNVYQALQNDMAKASSQGVAFDKDFLLGQGWDESTLSTLDSKMKELSSTFKNFQSSAKIELGDMGISGISDMAKEIDNLSQSLSQNTFGAQMGDLQKTLDQFSNIDTPEFTSMREQLTGFYQDLTDMRSAFDSDTGQLDVNKLLGMDNWDESKLSNWTTQFDNFSKNVKNSVKEFKDMEGNVDLDKVIGNIGSDAKMNNYTKQIDDLRTSISKLGDSDVKTSLNQQANDVQDAYNKMVDSINKFQATSKESSEYKINMDAATQSVQEFQSKLISCRSSVQEFTSSGSSGMTSFVSSVSSGLNGAIDMLNKMFGYNAIFREMRQVAQDCVSTIREVDSAMNQLEIVTGATASEMEEFFEASIGQAKELGQSVTDVLDSIQVYSRLGYNLEEASELAEYTSILSNVANVGTEEATQGLTSVIKGFDMSVDDAEHVADVLIDIGQSYAVSASEILEAFTRSSAAFGATGTTFEEASAIIAAGNAAVQDASTVGVAMKTKILCLGVQKCAFSTHLNAA